MGEKENNSGYSDTLKSPTSLKLQIQNDKGIEEAINVKEGKISDFFANFDSKVADAAKNVKQIVKEMEK